MTTYTNTNAQGHVVTSYSYGPTVPTGAPQEESIYNQSSTSTAKEVSVDPQNDTGAKSDDKPKELELSDILNKL